VDVGDEKLWAAKEIEEGERRLAMAVVCTVQTSHTSPNMYPNVILKKIVQNISHTAFLRSQSGSITIHGAGPGRVSVEYSS
jgi:hypothetical protein